ncbi:hypothetical protein DPEC_G00290670 [Dallia pectoralis]|uniref:Uncharacterized protein n=1 Tax=Dallia pectoralis TaxID=75939 RepID=A0ACC2FHT3_DALPE|nr:hypothetical protein DPEC_G00290670 [Dallia pectoralis]
MPKVVYKVSSTTKLVQLEAELSAQLSALRTEIEGNGSPLETPLESCSSVPVPEDLLYFRKEREQVLKRGLQVAEALPLVSPSDVIQRELESCFNLEYTTESLPLLLHQFYTDQCYQLAQVKYQLMLRWRRFGRHSHIIEQLYPFYKNQMSHLVSEYEDALQRSRRLAVSREKVLTGQGNPINYVTLGDVTIYLTWLICHLHSKKTIHHFLRVLSEFRELFKKQEEMKTFLQYDGTEAAALQWGRKRSSLALRKSANWIPYIQATPKRDPWQQKLATKLKELQSYDDLLRTYCQFLQLSDPGLVTEALTKHASQVCDSKVILPTSTLTSSPTSRHNPSQVWSSIYNAAANLSQESQECGEQHKSNKNSRTSSVEKINASYLNSLEGEDGATDPVTARGAYLSLLYLRHLKIRELQRICLGILNYLRSIEKTLTFDTAGMRVEKEGGRAGGKAGGVERARGRGFVSSAEESSWMNAARGGSGTVGGLSSHLYSQNTPVDYKVHCSEFMQFPEVENLHDFYTTEERYIHTQDHRGLYVIYDVALKDLEELEDTLTLLGSHFLQRSRRGAEESAEVQSENHLDRVAVLLDLWTCEAMFLESKVQLLNCYFEAYQHVTGPEERFSMAQVITDIMHRRPRLDLDVGAESFVQTYRAEMVCLQTHQQLIRAVLNSQIERQRQYLRQVWRGDQVHGATPQDYGLPPNYVAKHSVPALIDVFLLEVHPSLSLASEVYQGLIKSHTQLSQLHCARGMAERVSLEQRLLEQALEHWHSLAPPGASYSSQIQNDLFSDLFMKEPSRVRAAGMSLLGSAEDRDVNQGKGKQTFAVETFSMILEIVTIHHRLVESAAETEHLAQLYRTQALELGFDEAHLYLRPVWFELALNREETVGSAKLQDDKWMDRYTPSCLPLSIQELDENHVGKFSFSTEDAVVHLMNRSAVENLQVILACQVTQKNALIGAVKQVCLCYWSETFAGSPEEDLSSSSDSDFSLKQGPKTTGTGTKTRLAEAFVSIQLEKVGLREEMLNSFIKRRQTMNVLMYPDEVAKITRRLILEFCQKFSKRTATCCIRAQIIGTYSSLTALLDELPDIRQSHFLIGQAHELKCNMDSEPVLHPDPRKFQRRPRLLLSADGRTVLNLWFLPHYTEVLQMFRTLEDSACDQALHHTLEIVSGLHDIVYYLVTFARLGNSGAISSRSQAARELTADWGGSEGIGAELWELQRQVNSLCEPGDPQAVGRLLQLRRQVLFLQYDTAVRHLVREGFLSSGNIAAYQSVSDNMGHALPALSGSVLTNHSSRLLLPQPLDPSSPLAQWMYPWRSFLACHGLHPVHIWDIPPIENCLQLCVSGLGGHSRTVANGAMLGVSLLMEDVLDGGWVEAEPVRLRDNDDDDSHEKPGEGDGSSMDGGDEERNQGSSSVLLQDPLHVQSVLKGFLLLTKQLEVFKESWGRRQLGVEQINTVSIYRQFSILYRAEVQYPSMRALALHMGKEKEFKALLSHNEPITPPAGASEVDIKTFQLSYPTDTLPSSYSTFPMLLRLLEMTECDMIRAVQRRLTRELTLVTSERAHQDTGLPTELWKRGRMKYNVSPERPQIVENFVHQLMEGIEEIQDGQLSIPRAHLQCCLSTLGCTVMERERRSFLLYSQFYEQMLEQERQLLYHQEQDLKSLDRSQRDIINPYGGLSELCGGTMMKTTTLHTRIAQLEEEQRGLQQQISLQYRKRYDSLVRQLFSNCVQLKARLDEYHVSMFRDANELVSQARREGVDSIIKLKKRFASTKDNGALMTTQLKKQELHDLSMENSRLTGLLCKVKALAQWRLVSRQGKLVRELLHSQQREMTCRKEVLKMKMTSEEEVISLTQELEVSQRATAQCQREYNHAKRLLAQQRAELNEVSHLSAQEAQSRREVDMCRLRSLEQLREEAEQRDRQLRDLGAQLDKSERERRLQRQRSAKDIRQVKGQLLQERSLKQEAFQWVGKIQSQVVDTEPSLSRITSTAGRSKSFCYTTPQNRSSIRCPERAGSLQDKTRMENITQLERPKTDPVRLRVLSTETRLPDH